MRSILTKRSRFLVRRCAASDCRLRTLARRVPSTPQAHAAASSRISSAILIGHAQITVLPKRNLCGWPATLKKIRFLVSRNCLTPARPGAM
jgi:hypothetical protein